MKNLIKSLAVIILDVFNFLVHVTSILFLVIKKPLNMITVNAKKQKKLCSDIISIWIMLSILGCSIKD